MNKKRMSRCLRVITGLAILSVGNVWAADQTKANNATPLDQAGSWIGNVVPGSGDRAIWNGTLSAANCTNTVNTTINVGQIQIKSPSAGVPVRISQGTNTAWWRLMGVGGACIDMSTATVDLTIGSGFTVQSWNTGTFFTNQTGRTLTISGGLYVGSAAGQTLTLDGGGNYVLSGSLNGGGTLIKNGSGAVTINIPNYNTNFVLNAGTFNLNQAFAINGNANSLMTINGGTINNTSGSAVSLVNNPPRYLWNGNFTFTGTTNLNLGSGTVTLGGNRQVTCNANTLTVGGAISGSGYSLTKAGTGTLSLSGTNTYSGATIISGGTLSIDVAGRLGQGTYTNNITNNATFNYASSSNQTLSGSIRGTGSLTKSGASTLTLSGVNTYSGTTTVSAGKLLFSRGASTTADYAGTGDYSIASGATMEVNGTASARFNISNKQIKGAGTFIKSGSGRTFMTAGTSTLSFNMSAGGLIDIQGGILDSSAQSTNLASLNIATGAQFLIANSDTITTLQFDALNGGGTLNMTGAGTRTVVLGANGGSGTFSGVIGNSGTISLTKNGAGTQTLSGANTYTGTTTINAGTLTVPAANTSIGSVAVNGGKLGISITNSTKQWTCASLAFNNSGTALNFSFGLDVVPSTTLAPLKVTGAAAFTATPTVTVNLGYYAGAVGAQYPLMTWGSKSGTAPSAVTITAPSPGVVTGHLTVSGTTLYLVIDSVSGIPKYTGLTITFNSNGVPTSLMNKTGTELLSGTSDGFYLLDTNSVKHKFNLCTNLGYWSYSFAISGYPGRVTVQFGGENDYLTCRFTSMTNFALAGERLYFGLTTTSSKIKALALDHMMSVANSATLAQVERMSLWEQVIQSPTNLLGGFAVYQNISPAQEDSTFLDLWTKEGMAHPKVTGNWDRAAAQTWLTNWINAAYDGSYINILPSTLAEHSTFIPYATTMDAKAIYLWNEIWRGEYWLQYRQNDQINPVMYPNGLADLVTFKNTLASSGKKLMFHYLSGNIGEEDIQFTKPNVSPDLQSWGTVTLTAAINATATTMTVQPAAGVNLPIISTSSRPMQGPPVLPSFFDFKTFRIGSEWINASSVTNLGNGTWRLDGVSRGQWGTTAQSYSASTSLRGYMRPYGKDFIPDPDSALFTNITTRWATLNNTLGTMRAEFDGYENHMATGTWGAEKFGARVYESLDHPTVANTSSGAAPNAWLEYQFNQVKDALGGSFQTRQAIPLYLGNPSRTAPGLEEMEVWMNNYFSVNNRGFSIGSYDVRGVSLSTLTSYGLTDGMLTLAKNWKNVSLPVSAATRASMNTFTVSTPAAKQALFGSSRYAYLWRLENVNSLRKWYALGTDIYTNQWMVGLSESGSIAPRFYVTNGQTQTLIVPAALSSGAQQTRIIGRVLPRFDSTNSGNINLMTYLGTTNLTVTRANATGAAIWDETTLTKYVVGTPNWINLTTNRGLGLWVTGDNSGATLVIRLSRGGGGRDYVVPINFTGRRWIVIPSCEAGWRVSNWGWTWMAGQTIDYQYIDNIKIGIGHIPASTTCSVKVDGLVAMKETAEGLVNPTITLGGQSVNVTGTIASGNNFILEPNGLFTVYTTNWVGVSTQQLSGLLPASLTSFKMQSASSSSNIWLEIGVQAAPGAAVPLSMSMKASAPPASSQMSIATSPEFNMLVGANTSDADSTRTMHFLGTQKGVYVLEEATSLTSPITWTPVVTNTADSVTGNIDFTIPINPDQPTSYFRARLKQ